MKYLRWAALPLAVLLVLTQAPARPRTGPSQAGAGQAADQIKKIEDAARVLEEMLKESDKGIPASLVRDCAGIAIIPDVIRAGLVIGGRHGRGILLVRGQNGGWSDPSFIEITGGSIGWQAGVQSADVVLVFRTPRSVEHLGEGKFTLGADAGVAAGPLGRTAEASTDAALKAEILSYSRSRGLYAGLTLQGTSIQEDRKANRDLYGADVSPRDIFGGQVRAAAGLTARLKAALAELAKAK